jgi:hypothetical protein
MTLAIRTDEATGLKVFNTRAAKATDKIGGKGDSAIEDEALKTLPAPPPGAVFDAEEQAKYRAFKEVRRGAADFIAMEGEFTKYLQDVYSAAPVDRDALTDECEVLVIGTATDFRTCSSCPDRKAAGGSSISPGGSRLIPTMSSGCYRPCAGAAPASSTSGKSRRRHTPNTAARLTSGPARYAIACLTTTETGPQSRAVWRITEGRKSGMSFGSQPRSIWNPIFLTPSPATAEGKPARGPHSALAEATDRSI